MRARHRSGGGLAGRIILVTLLVGAIMAVTAAGVALVGASELASQQVTARQQASLQLVQDEIEARFSEVQVLASRIAETVASQPDPRSIQQDLAPLYAQSGGLATRFVVARPDGAVLAALPASAEQSSAISSVTFRDALAGSNGFRRVSRQDGTWELWLTRTIVTADEKPAILVVVADSSFLPAALRQAGGSNRAVSVLEDGRPLASSFSADPPELAHAVWRPASKGAGTVSAVSAGGAGMAGIYSDVSGIEGVTWRVAVLEPRSQILTETLRLITPTLLLLALGGVLGIGGALALSRRLTKPLAALEATAYRAANGSFVEPVAPSSPDEIGHLATAFNAVALRLNALHDLSQLMASASRLDQVLDGILSAMRHLVGPGTAAIYLLDEEGEWLVPARARGVDAALVRRVRTSDAGGWLVQALERDGVLLHEADPAAVEVNLPGLATGQPTALIAPLVASGQPLGAIVVLRGEDEHVSAAEAEMVRTFSAQASVALRNSRLFEAETESVRVAEALRSVAERLSRSDALAFALPDVEDVVTDLFDAEGSVFAVVDRRALGLPPAEDVHLEASLLAFAKQYFAEHGEHPAVVSPGDDAAADAAIAHLGASALLTAPIALESEHGAVLAVSLNRTSVPQHDLDLAEAVANEVALALDNAYLYERAVARAGNLETVFRISQAVGSSLQVDVVLNRVLDVVQKILSADAVALATWDPAKRALVTAMARGDVPPQLMRAEIEPGQDVPGYVFSTGEPALLRDLEPAHSGIGALALEHGLHSLLAVPLLARGHSMGVLMALSAEKDAFSGEDMNLLQTFALQAALAIDTAKLYSREHEVAQILQESILPEALPQFPEIEASSAYQPAGGQAEIGGDYYDLFRGPDGAIWFAIGDVCGKGVRAATKTSGIKYSVRALVAAGLTPSLVLGEVNRMVCEAGDASDIVTLWVGRLYPETGELVYANAGHPPAIVTHKSASPERSGATGALLGALASVVYGEETVWIESGDVVLLYTDGVTESRNGNQFFGETRVEEAAVAGGSTEEIVRRLLTQVRRWAHGELRDDVAVLAIALKPEAREHNSARKEEAGA